MGVIAGDFVEGFLQKRLPPESVVGFKNHEAIIEELRAGRLKIFAADTPTGLFHLRESGLGDAFTYPAERPLYSNTWHLAAGEGKKDLIAMVNAGMVRITAEEKSRIARAWTATGGKKKDADSLVIAIDRDYPPFSWISPGGRPTGLLVELWKLWGAETSNKVRFRMSDWKGTLDALKTGKADIHAGLFRNEVRAAWMDFSEPIHETKTFVYFRQGEKARSLAELGAIRVGAVSDTYQEQFLLDRYKDVRVTGIQTGKAAINALIGRQVDAFVGEAPAVEANLNRLGLQGQLVRGPDELISNLVHAGVAKGRADLVKKINQGFGAIPFAKMARLDKLWLPNPVDRFYREGEGKVRLSDAESDWIANHPFLRFAVTDFIRPVDIVDNEGNYTGLNADLIALLNKKMGINIVPEFFKKWSDVVEAATSGKVDGVFSFSRTAEREKHVFYTKPYSYDPIILIVRQGETSIAKWEDMAGKRVSVVKGMSLTDEVREQVGAGRLIEVENETQALRMLADGKTDAHASFLMLFGNAQKKTYIPGLNIVVKRNTEGGTLRVAVHKSRPLLFSAMQKGVNALTRQELAQLRERWLMPKPAGSESGLNLTDKEKVWLQRHKRIRVMAGTWPPFHFVEDRAPKGLALDYVSLILKRLGIEPQFVPTKWAEGLSSISKLEKIDLLPTIARSAEREKMVKITRDYLSFPRVIFTRKGEREINSLMDLHGRTVSVERNFITHKLLVKDHPEVKLLVVGTTKEALEAVSFGKADAFISNLAVGSYLIEKHGMLNLKVAARTTYKSDIQAMGVRRDWPELASMIDKVLANLTEKEKRDLNNRWLSLDAWSGALSGETGEATSSLDLVLQIGGGAVAITVMLIVISLLLRMRLAKDASQLYESRQVKGLAMVLIGLFLTIVVLGAWFTLQNSERRMRAEIGNALDTVLTTTQATYRQWLKDGAERIKGVSEDADFHFMVEALLEAPPNRRDLMASPELAEMRA